MQHAEGLLAEESKAQVTAETGSQDADPSKSPSCEQSPGAGEIHVSSIARECAVCGLAGLTVLCVHDDCERAVHSWCAEQQQLFNKSGLACPSHSETRRTDWKVQAAGRSQLVSGDPEAVREFRSQYSEFHLDHVSTGNVFWYVMCAQYFPGLEIARAPPHFHKHVGGYRPKDLLQWCQSKEGVWDLESCLNSTMADLARTQQHVFELLAQLAAAQKAEQHQFTQFPCSGRTTEDEWVLKDIKLVEFKGINKCYLKFFELKERVVQPEVQTISSRGLEAGDDFPCAICGDGDYEDDNLIVICEGCEQGVHIKCYGIPAVPEGAWLCDMCQVLGPQAVKLLPCALCPIKGGVLKRTVHVNDGSLDLSHYPVFDVTRQETPDNPKQVWVHIFCAIRVPKITITNSDQVDGIHLESIEQRRFKLTCEVCGSRTGACIKCAQKKCSAAFHPECGKTFFLFTGWKLGHALENQIYCNQHRTFRLRKLVEMKERCALNEIAAFFREWEKWLPKWRLQTSEQRMWTEEESALLEEKVKLFLSREYCGPKIPFTITLGMTGQDVMVQMPLVCNLMEAKVILQRGISIPGRSSEECAIYYEKSLYPVMKKQLEDSNKPVFVLQGHRKIDKKKPKKSVISKKIPVKKQIKRKQKSREKTPEKKRHVPLDPIVTTELFCVCRRPYVEQLPKREDEEEETYQIRLRDSSMIQCPHCQQWFHFGCVQYRGSAQDAEEEEAWMCPGCRPSQAV